MLRHICQLKLQSSIWKPVVRTELTECQPRKQVSVNPEGLDVTVTQCLEARNKGAERYGQSGEEWVGNPGGPQSRYPGEVRPLPAVLLHEGRGVWGTRAESGGRQLKSRPINGSTQGFKVLTWCNLGSKRRKEDCELDTISVLGRGLWLE